MTRMAKLERVFGCTAGLSSFHQDPTTGVIGYAAGSTTVIVGRNNLQTHLVNNSKNNITCLAFSCDGRYLATGEFGSDPMVRVWEISKDVNTKSRQVAELKGHSLGINCIKFSRDSKYVISVGNQHDRSVVVWNRAEKRKVVENRLTSPVNSMDVSLEGNVFVTVGVRHVKFWNFADSDRALNGRSAILAEQRTNTFLDVVCASGNRTFTVTTSKVLVEFHDKKIVNVFELTGGIPNTITMGPKESLLIGYTKGKIQRLDPKTLEGSTLSGKSHYLHYDISEAQDFNAFYEEMFKANENQFVFPDCRAIIYNEKHDLMTVLYSDRSIYQWILNDNFQQCLLNGYRYHVGPILDLEMVKENYPWISAGTFITTGVDATLRFWNFDKQEITTSILSNNILNPDLKKILYLNDNDEKCLKDVEDCNSGMIINDSLETTTGARCLKLKPDGRHLSVGYRDGNLIIFDITTTEFKKIACIEAHDGEILCSEYSNPNVYNSICILATGGRDRLIHLFAADNGYTHINSVEDHSSSVNSIRFISIPTGYELFTCGTDKLVVIRRIEIDNNDGNITLERINQFCSQSGLNYLTTGPEDSLIFACQDRQLRTYTMTGKLIKQVKGTLCDEGTLTKLTLDPSGTYAATVCSNRYVYLIEISTGECVAVLNGQSDCITAIEFTPDCRRLVIVSHSGCVFAWRLSNMLTKKMMKKLDKIEDSTERSATPDSVIDSGSDTASLTGGKKHNNLLASESEFGSLTSIVINNNDDDLDSGVGGASKNPIIDIDSKENHFQIKRLPQEVVRRTSSSYLNTPEFDSDRISPDNQDMLSSHHQQPNSYVASRSMSNLHRTSASPQRIRKKWNDLNTNSPSPVNPMDYSNSLQQQQQQQNHIHHQQQQHVYQQPSTPKNHFQNTLMSQSISLHGLRNYSHYESPIAASTPKNTFAPVPLRNQQQHQQYDYSNQQRKPSQQQQQQQYSDAFDRSNATRNSLTKKFMNLGVSSSKSSTGEPKAIWTPPKPDSNRRPSALFNNHGIQRRQSERPSTNMSSSESSKHLYQTNNLNNTETSESPDDIVTIQMRTKKTDRQKRGRMTMSDCFDLRDRNTVSMSKSNNQGLNSLQEEDYETSNLHLRTSQSNLLNLDNESRSRSNLRNPSDVGSRITPSSSRSNLRSMSTTMNKSSQALNKILEAREKLKKSQENLSVMINDEVPSSSNTSNNMSRSRSIGNLKFNRITEDINCGFETYQDGLSDTKRQMARSVTSLHNGGDDDSYQHPDDVTLKNQYSGGNSRSRLADSIKNLKKISNPDLTNEHLYDQGESSNVHQHLNESTSSSSNAAPVGVYYTLPKNARTKGPVSKRVHSKVTARIDQTSESDSNASDQTPNNGFNNSFIKANGSYIGSGYLRSTGPNRSSSSVESGRTAATRRAFESMQIKKPNNYLAQKISQQDNPEYGLDDSTSRFTSSGEVPMSDEYSKKMAMHLYDCIEQFNTACDKILGARQMIDSDTTLSTSDREKLLRLVSKSIIQGKNRLEGIDSSRTVSSITGGSSTSMSSKIQSSSPTVSNVEPKIQIDNNFMNKYGPQIMQLLQHNMAKQN